MTTSETPLTRRSMLVVTAGAAAAAAVPLTAAPASAASSKADPQDVTIVLVHGAFADASSWSGVVQRLQRRGFRTVAVANPLRNLATDAAYVDAVVRAQPGPVVMVSHSYGGAVTTVAAAGNPAVKAIVYIAGFAPAVGESAAGLSALYPGSTLGDTLEVVPLPGGDVDLTVAQALFPQQFAHDVRLRDARVMAATQRPVTGSALGSPTAAVAWQDIPSWFLVPTGDKNIPPAAQHFMATRAGGVVVEAAGASHAVLVSQPETVVALVRAAVRAV